MLLLCTLFFAVANLLRFAAAQRVFAHVIVRILLSVHVSELTGVGWQQWCIRQGQMDQRHPSRPGRWYRWFCAEHGYPMARNHRNAGQPRLPSL